jgi:hypothetical protein
VWGKLNQENTPIESSSAAVETVTIVDPRHPLYSQTFPLLHIKNKQKLIPSCLVRLPEGVERLVPIEMTNLAPGLPDMYPLPLDVSSLQNLAKAFALIQAGAETECGDDQTEIVQPIADGNDPLSCMGNADSDTADDDLSDGGVHLSQPNGAREAGGKK